MTETTKNDVQEPEAWVGCLACYNAGTLRGEWVAGVDAGDFVPCEGRGHEEWWVFDFQGYWSALSGECSPVEAQRVAEAFAALPDYVDPRAFGAWVSDQDGDVNEPDRFEEQYRGAWDSLEEYAEEFWRETAGSHEEIEAAERWPFTHIDWQAAARDLELGGDVSTVERPDGGIWVFEPNA